MDIDNEWNNFLENNLLNNDFDKLEYNNNSNVK